MWYENVVRLFFVLSQIVRLTDRRTDRQTDTFLMASPRCHFMQRGKNVRLFVQCNVLNNATRGCVVPVIVRDNRARGQNGLTSIINFCTLRQA